jgi:hypothetical protein
MRRFVAASLAAAVLIAASCIDASAASKCAKGEVWGDFGCQPKTEPSLMARAAKKLKTGYHKTKPAPTAAVPKSN